MIRIEGIVKVMKIIKSFQGLRVIAMLFIFFFHFKMYEEGSFANIYNKLF